VQLWGKTYFSWGKTYFSTSEGYNSIFYQLSDVRSIQKGTPAAHAEHFCYTHVHSQRELQKSYGADKRYTPKKLLQKYSIFFEIFFSVLARILKFFFLGQFFLHIT
jgi:hypothetical protein